MAGPAQVPVSAEELVKFFKECGYPLKKNLRQPTKLARNLAKWKPVSREKAMAKMYAHMADRHIMKTYSEKPDDKQNNPVASSHGTKGLGKSFFGDTVCEFREEDIEKYTPKELSEQHRKRMQSATTPGGSPRKPENIAGALDSDVFKQKLKGAVAVTVSYTDLKRGCQVDRECCTAGFALRVLFS